MKTIVKKVEPSPKTPYRIKVTYADPFDGKLLCSSEFPYNKRMSADGFYTRGIRVMCKGLKSIQSHILEGREPKPKVEIIYAS